MCGFIVLWVLVFPFRIGTQSLGSPALSWEAANVGSIWETKRNPKTLVLGLARGLLNKKKKKTEEMYSEGHGDLASMLPAGITGVCLWLIGLTVDVRSSPGSHSRPHHKPFFLGRIVVALCCEDAALPHRGPTQTHTDD